MLATGNSHCPVNYWNMTEVKPEQAQTVKVMAEIDMYLAGLARMYTWMNYVGASLGSQDESLWRRHVGLYRNLRTSWVSKLPIQYQLKQTFGGHNCYRTWYDSGSALPESRPVVLANVAGLLNCMRACEDAIDNETRLTQERRVACKMYMKEAKEMFETWMEEARPHVIPSQGALRRREETGRRPGTAPAAYRRRGAGAPTPELAHMQALLREMQDCTRVGV